MENFKEILITIKKELDLEKMYLKHMISGKDKDIDIVISKADFNKIDFPENYKIIRKKLSFNNHIFIVRIDNKTKNLNLLDFHIDGLEYCNVFKIYFDEIKNNSIRILNPEIYVLDKNYFYLDRYLGYIFFKAKKERTLKYIKDNKTPIDFLSNKLKLKHNQIENPILVKNKLVKNNFKSFILYRIFNIPKISKKVKIALIGIDGSGKTSTIIELEKRLSCLKISIGYMGWKDFKFLPIKIYESFIGHKKWKNSNHNNLKSFGLLSLVVFYTELYIRYLKQMISGKNVVIFDRFFYDRLTRTKSNLTYKLFNCLVPPIDLVFYMTAPVEILYQRKKESTVSNIKQIQSAFEKKERDIKYKCIDTNKCSREEVAGIITEEIFNLLPNEIYKFKS